MIVKQSYLSLIIVFFVLLSVHSYTQELDSLNLGFEEVTTNVESPPYFGLGGGYIGAFSLINLDEVNNVNQSIGFENFTTPIFISGAEGFTAIPFVSNLRIGFFGASGTISKEITSDSAKYGTKASLQYTGFRIDYGFVPTKSIAILVGSTLGWSSLTFEYYKSKNNLNWNSIPQFENDPNNAYRAINGTFWFIEPNFNIEFAPTTFLMMRLGLSYPFAFLPDWKGNQIAKVDNVPSKIKPNGLQIKIGLFIGLFNY
ncbi:MAG: hypothetical protein ACUVQ1_00145 [Candidatus Kapaibacteriales bacterium]